MNNKEKTILKLIGELHEYCRKNKILYYLAENEKTPWSATLCMDAANLKKFAGSFRPAGENRAIEWRGNNHSILGDHMRYVDLDTFYYTEERLVREIYLGMFVKIAPIGKGKSRWRKLDRFRKYLGFEKSTRRSAAANLVAGRIYSDIISRSGGKISKKDLTEVEIDGVRFYVKKGSAFCDAPEECFSKLIVKKGNNEAFICDETISYRDIDLESDRKRLSEYNRKLVRPKVRYKRSQSLQGRCVAVANASYYRYCVATDLLMKYSYQEIIDKAGEEPVRSLLETYMERANKMRKKQQSVYIGDEFTKVIKAVYPDVDTDDLYKYTPELYKEGIRVYDWKGDVIGVYGGSNGQ